MKPDKEGMLKAYNDFKSLCLEKGYEFKFDGIHEYMNGKYAVLMYWQKENQKEAVKLTSLEEGDVLTTMQELYQKAIESLIKYG